MKTWAAGMALILFFLAAGRASSSQASQPGWEILRRVGLEQDVPSTDAERARSPLAPDPARVVYLVRPRDTDPRIDHFLKDHYVLYHRGAPPNGKLFVFFPGTWGRPYLYQFLLDEAAAMGYKAVGLEYVDDTEEPTASAVGQICVRDPDPDCSAEVRRARIAGGVAHGVRVSTANGIENRLEKLLDYLRLRHPDEGWDRFLGAGTLRWDRLALGGHSQGAGMAAFLAKAHRVTRVALWSGPADFVAATRQLAPWMRVTSVTPQERWYAMAHREEPGIERLLDAYRTLGIPGSPTPTDGPVPDATHQYLAVLPPRPGPSLPPIASAAHGSVAADARTPLVDGHPAYRPLWRMMIGE